MLLQKDKKMMERSYVNLDGGKTSWVEAQYLVPYQDHGERNAEYRLQPVFVLGGAPGGVGGGKEGQGSGKLVMLSSETPTVFGQPISEHVELGDAESASSTSCVTSVASGSWTMASLLSRSRVPPAHSGACPAVAAPHATGLITPLNREISPATRTMSRAAVFSKSGHIRRTADLQLHFVPGHSGQVGQVAAG
ncbi:hypothetical protein IWZ00DRAFT_267445 [Phyllosticta capitalensis]